MSEKQKKLLLALCLLFAVNMLTIVLVGRVHADLYKRGASGATVTEIQTRLKAWGYYDGAVELDLSKLEPMIDAGTWEVEWLDDDWTVVTADGSLSAHYENTVLITDGDPEILTLSK